MCVHRLFKISLLEPSSAQIVVTVGRRRVMNFSDQTLIDVNRIIPSTFAQIRRPEIVVSGVVFWLNLIVV